MTAAADQPESVPTGRVALVATGPMRDRRAETLMTAGYDVHGFDDPYAAMLAICRKPLVFRALAVSLQAIYPKELDLVSAVAQRFPHVRLLACDTDGRRTTLIDAVQRGVTDILDDHGITPADTERESADVSLANPAELTDEETAALARPTDTPTDPVLTPEEIRALLSDGR
ncbi:MAG: hypothetical protein AAF656_11435 [Planctomycetota bacterium]